MMPPEGYEMPEHRSLIDIKEEIKAKVDQKIFQITGGIGGMDIQAAADAMFAEDNTTLRADARSDLAIIANELATGSGGMLSIGAYTDDQGDAASNEALSQKQAEAVADVFGAAGFLGGFSNAKGYGEAHPVVPNTSAENRARNRRIEIAFHANIH